MEFMNSRNLTHRNINGLCPEIMDEVFSFVDGSNDYSMHRIDDSRKPFPRDYFCAPVLLSSVCRYWRAIALGQPKLWTNLYVNLCRRPNQLTVTEEWLDRSRSLPLNLTLYASPSRINESITSLFNLLRKHSTRWGRLNVRFAPRDTLYRLFHDLKELPPSHAFYLQIGECYNAYRLDPLLQPSRFYSKGGVNPTSGSVLPFGWKNLTDLELCSWNAKDVLSVIEHASGLKRCLLRSISSKSQANAAQIPVIQPVVHECLHELKFNGSTPDFFPNITLPSLRHLEIKSAPRQGNPERWSWDDLSTFLDRCKIDPKSLDTFILGYSPQQWPDSPRFQEIRAAVTHLSVHSENILDSLLLDVDFPRLRELQFHVISLLNSTQDHRITPTLKPKTWEALYNYIDKYKTTPRQRKFRPSLKSITVLYKRSTYRAQIILGKDTPLPLWRKFQNEVVAITKFEIRTEDDGVRSSMNRGF